MNFQQLAPPAYLEAYVRYFWILEPAVDNLTPRTFLAIADGCPGIIFHQSNIGPAVQNGQELSPVFLYGQTTQPAVICSPAQFCSIGVYFHPHALRSVFGIDAHELTDGCADPCAFDKGFRLQERLLHEPDHHKKVMLISAFLWQRIQANKRKTDPSIQHALRAINASNGTLQLPALQEQLYMTERTFERKFRQDIGMSPRMFARISRFQAAFRQLRNRSFSKLSDVAFEHAYADQSHFIRAFKEFAGCTPNMFFKTAHETVENYPELVR